MQRVQVSEALCRKGGTSRSDNAPHASGACAGAKLACGATLSATREFVGLCGCSTCLWRQPFCDAGICGFVRVFNLLVAPAILRCGILRGSGGCLVHTFERPVLFRGIKLQTDEAEFARVK